MLSSDLLLLKCCLCDVTNLALHVRAVLAVHALIRFLISKPIGSALHFHHSCNHGSHSSHSWEQKDKGPQTKGGKIETRRQAEAKEQSSLAALTALPNSKSSFVKSFLERLSTKLVLSSSLAATSRWSMLSITSSNRIVDNVVSRSNASTHSNVASSTIPTRPSPLTAALNSSLLSCFSSGVVPRPSREALMTCPKAVTRIQETACAERMDELKPVPCSEPEKHAYTYH
jgi:hypothetical protein